MGESITGTGGTGVEGTPSGRRRGIAAAIGAVGAALLASLCCIGPMLFVTVGVGAGMASQFEPLRPLFTILTIGLIAAGFYSVYGRRDKEVQAASCDADGLCNAPVNRTRAKVMLWAATLVALVLLTFPRWSLWLL
ncbi:MAG: mercuric transporter MerT family protein [Gemmatimonadaceae bacterium]